MTDVGWTVDEACAEFARTGIPVDPVRLRLIIRGVELKPVGEAPPGEKGGRGDRLYPIADLQRLHGALAPWLAPQHPAGGDT